MLNLKGLFRIIKSNSRDMQQLVMILLDLFHTIIMEVEVENA